MVRIALATARLTRLMVEDTIFEDVRDRLADRNEFLAEMLDCRWCAGIWAAGAILITDRVAPRVVDMLAAAQAGTMTMSLAERIER